MELEKLNKSQIVLLTLLVSFVTSIATGIVTVSLLDQAPPAITQTVNRVVERTIEKVSPTTQAASAAVVAQPETVILRESDLIAGAIQRVSPSVVRLFGPGKDEAGKDIRLFVGFGIVTDKSGILIADPGTPDTGLTGIRADGIEIPLSVISRPQGVNVIRLQAATTTGTGEDEKALDWKPLALSMKTAELGKRVVAIAGRTSPRVAEGIITGTSEVGEKDSKVTFVETNIAGEAFAAGSPLLDIDGNVIAIATRASRNAASGGFLASSSIVLQNNEDTGGPDGQ